MVLYNKTKACSIGGNGEDGERKMVLIGVAWGWCCSAKWGQKASKVVPM